MCDRKGQDNRGALGGLRQEILYELLDCIHDKKVKN